MKWGVGNHRYKHSFNLRTWYLLQSTHGEDHQVIKQENSNF